MDLGQHDRSNVFFLTRENQMIVNVLETYMDMHVPKLVIQKFDFCHKISELKQL